MPALPASARKPLREGDPIEVVMASRKRSRTELEEVEAPGAEPASAVSRPKGLVQEVELTELERGDLPVRSNRSPSEINDRS
jgi:hypothetical protein